VKTLKNRLTYFGLGAAALAVLVFASMPAASQNNAAAAQPKCIGCSPDGKTTPRTADGHPDLGGFWNNPAENAGHLSARGDDGSVLFDFSGNELDDQGRPVSALAGAKFGLRPSANQPTYKPEYAAKVNAIDKASYGVANPADPMYDCKPDGIPRGSFGAMQIVQTPPLVAVLYESGEGMAYRLIYTDGRPHPDDVDTSYMGDSIGHWDGDTLVVDVTGLNDETWLAGGFAGPRNGLIHSDKEHVVERWTRKGDDLQYDATVEDPVMFTKPWVIPTRHIHHAAADDRLLESTCRPNDKSHIVAPTADDQFECNYCSRKSTDGLSHKAN